MLSTPAVVFLSEEDKLHDLSHRTKILCFLLMQISTPALHKRLTDLACAGFRPARTRFRPAHAFWYENVSQGPNKQGGESIFVYYGILFVTYVRHS